MKIYADGIKRALFATDYPVFDPGGALQDLQHIRESNKLPNTDEPLISDEEWELMTHLNAERVILHQENH
jgi:predicted TIM-barrel fold metal-dependent hydrolase